MTGYRVSVSLGLMLVAVAACGLGCAHHREAFYPNQSGVHVRAPFVDVKVPTGNRPSRDELGSIGDRSAWTDRMDEED